MRFFLLLSALWAVAPSVRAADCVNRWDQPQDALLIPAAVLSDGGLYALTLKPEYGRNDGDRDWYRLTQTPIANPGCTPTAKYDTATNRLIVRAIQDTDNDGPAGGANMDAYFAPSVNDSLDYALVSYRMQNVEVDLSAYMGRGFDHVVVETRNIDGSSLATKADNLTLVDDKSAFIVNTYQDLPSAFQIKLSFYDTASGTIQSYKASVTHYEQAGSIELNPLTTLASTWLQRHPDRKLSEAEARVRTFIGVDKDAALAALGSNPGGKAFNLEMFQRESDKSGGLNNFIIQLQSELEAGETHPFRIDAKPDNPEQAVPPVSGDNAELSPRAEAYPTQSNVANRASWLLHKTGHILSGIFFSEARASEGMCDTFTAVANSGVNDENVKIRAVARTKWLVKTISDTKLVPGLGEVVSGISNFADLARNLCEIEDKDLARFKGINANLDLIKDRMNDIDANVKAILNAMDLKNYEDDVKTLAYPFEDIKKAIGYLSEIEEIQAKEVDINLKGQAKLDAQIRKDKMITEKADSFTKLMEGEWTIKGKKMLLYQIPQNSFGPIILSTSLAGGGLINKFNRYTRLASERRGYFNIRDEIAMQANVTNWFRVQLVWESAIIKYYAKYDKKPNSQLEYQGALRTYADVMAGTYANMPKNRISETCGYNVRKGEEDMGTCFLDWSNRDPTTKRPAMWQYGKYAGYTRHQLETGQLYRQSRMVSNILGAGEKLCTGRAEHLNGMGVEVEHPDYVAASARLIYITALSMLTKGEFLYLYGDHATYLQDQWQSANKWRIPNKAEWQNLLSNQRNRPGGGSKQGRAILAEMSGAEYYGNNDNYAREPNSYFIVADYGYEFTHDTSRNDFRHHNFPKMLIDSNTDANNLIGVRRWAEGVGGHATSSAPWCESMGFKPVWSMDYKLNIPLAFVPVRTIAEDEQYYE